MGTRARRGNRIFMVLSMVLAGLCLMRVLTVQADEVEVYASQEEGHHDDSARDEDKPEIRLTRPDEAEARIAEEQESYDQVPGVERIWAAEKPKNELRVPVKSGRAIASEPASERPVRDGVALPSDATSSQPAHGGLKAEVIRPHSSDRQDWVEHSPRGDQIAAARPSYGLKSEPRVETKIEPAVPQSSRVGVQEISVIVSDYGYFPNRVFVTQNVPVKIYMSTPSKNTLCFMIDSWGVKKGISPGKVEEVEFTPSSAGNFRFYCPVKSIEGTITVREAPLAEQSTRGLASYAVNPMGETAKATGHNEPKNANELRGLIED